MNEKIVLKGLHLSNLYKSCCENPRFLNSFGSFTNILSIYFQSLPPFDQYYQPMIPPTEGS